jgi:hypothetical protein
MIKVLLRTPAAAPASFLRMRRQIRSFFLLVHGTVPARRNSQRMVRTLPGEPLLPIAIYPA